jgi:hypothetical protein
MKVKALASGLAQVFIKSQSRDEEVGGGQKAGPEP